MLFQVVSNIAEKVDLFIEDDMRVGEVRVLIGQMIGADEETIRLTFQGHVLEDDTATWALVLKLYPLADDTPCKLFAHVSEKLRTGSASSEAMRAALMSVAGHENERDARAQAKMMEPVIDLMVRDPSTLDMMISINPGLKEMLNKHPELKRHFCDPETLKTLMMSQIDPDQRRSLSLGMGLQLAQLSAMPGGEQLFERMTSEYMNDMSALTETTGLSASDSVDEAQARPDPNKEANSEALPNPWEQQPSSAGGRLESNLMSQNPAGLLSLFGGGHNAGSAAPLAGLPSNLPFLLANGNPHTSTSFLPSWITTSSNVGGQAQPAGSTQAGETSRIAAEWAPQLAVLREMGFDNEALCLEALRASNGDIDGAVNYIADKDA
ncbi:ubiquilin [Trypanosoma rangeli]|uniref:Ubiquilin n=1 Tax=Trypanosoma rangeli TaxID=5698 RepID=A0A3R7MIY7_TRYRA|nr:ubiquilin [Trypanosoma rangeli]RNF06775.1 ubiquilin [Trypanosoma rangeli]|eukprot:RNF06775.1 ubiquilin [Trypanosoma rangeli]